MSSTRSAWFASLAAFALLAGCSGGGSSPVPTGGGSGPQSKTEHVTIVVNVPARGSGGSARHRDYVSPSTQGLGISYVAHGGTLPAIASPMQAYDVSSSSSLCTAGAGGSRTCTFTVLAPLGNDDFQISGWDATPSGGSFSAAKLLSAVTTTQNITDTGVNTLTFSMGVAVYSIFLRLSGLTGTTMIAGAPASATLNVEALDADGNEITGSDPFVDSSGNPLSITIQETMLPAGSPGTVTPSASTVTSPSNSAITLTYNGALIGSAVFAPCSCPTVLGTKSGTTLSFTISGTGFSFPANPLLVPYAPLSSSSAPADITSSTLDNQLWFTEYASKMIATSTTSGAVTEFGPTTSAPGAIAAAPDGDLYFTESDRIGRINPSTHEIDEFTTGLPSGATPADIATGLLWTMWFTDPANNDVDSFDYTTDTFTAYSVPGTPTGIAQGVDGNLYVTEQSAGAVAQVSPISGTVLNTYALPAGSNPTDIAVGSDNNLWVTEPGINSIAQVNPYASSVTQFTVPSAGSQVLGIASGIDGNLWFTEPGTGKFGRITTAGVVTEFNEGLSASDDLTGITSGPDGSLWFTESGSNAFGKLEP